MSSSSGRPQRGRSTTTQPDPILQEIRNVAQEFLTGNLQGSSSNTTDARPREEKLIDLLSKITLSDSTFCPNQTQTILLLSQAGLQDVQRKLAASTLQVIKLQEENANLQEEIIRLKAHKEESTEDKGDGERGDQDNPSPEIELPTTQNAPIGGDRVVLPHKVEMARMLLPPRFFSVSLTPSDLLYGLGPEEILAYALYWEQSLDFTMDILKLLRETVGK